MGDMESAEGMEPVPVFLAVDYARDTLHQLALAVVNVLAEENLVQRVPCEMYCLSI
jgi:hypothetical protein